MLHRTVWYLCIAYNTFCKILIKDSSYEREVEEKHRDIFDLHPTEAFKIPKQISLSCSNLAPKMSYLAILTCVVSTLHSTNAFCERLYENPFWKPKTLSQRAAEADIIIYGNVVESPCTKPVQKPFTTVPPVNATNSSSSVQQETPSSFKNITEGNTTDICLMRGLYNVTVNVSCVIKGGSVPHMIHLSSFGFGPEKCFYLHRGYNYMETVQSFHVYKGLNYLIFLGRHKGRSDSYGFWPHDVNQQSAAIEIIDEKFLKPIFEAAGGHAHSPEGANETHSICTPYIAGAGTHHATFWFVMAAVLASGLLFI